MRWMMHLERRKIHEKKTAGSKADACGDTAGIFYCCPVSVFHSFCGNQINFSRHCGRSAGRVELLSDCNSSASDLYLLFRKCFHKKKKPALSERMVHRLQKVKYIVLALILLSCLTGVYGKLTGTSPWDVFSMITAGRFPNSKYLAGIVILVLIMVGMCTQERVFCQFLCPMGAVFALMPILPGALFRRTSEKCPPKCGLCKKRCPAHLDIDGDTARSGECLCCHACAATCPRKNIHIGTNEGN